MASKLESAEKCWVGTSIQNIYYGHGPWDFDVTPILNCRYHAVLYELPATLKSPPKPHFSSQTHHWDNDYVRMPYSKNNLITINDKNGVPITRCCWEVIQESLLQPIKSSYELEKAIKTYNLQMPRFLALHNFFEKILEEEENEEFFDILLPRIIRLALRLPEILPGSIPLLHQGTCKSVSLSQLQISSLLANAFLCTFPLSKGTASYPGINFVHLFAAHLRPKYEQAVAEKLKCICHYFKRVLDNEPVGIVTYERKYIPRSQLPRWDRLESSIGHTKIHLASEGVIEDGAGLLQVDFANKLVGGGVLAFGCVQEEIRYIICPELIISRLFTEQLDATEALLVMGAERYSKYTGYSDTFVWAGNFQDKTPFDQFGRRRTNVVAIDALFFGKQIEQYHASYILRDLNKAFVGFHSRLEYQLPAVATGNWGCGAFRGDPKLKSLIQLMACNAARRDMVYFTFGDTKLRDSIYKMYLFLATNHITVKQLWSYLYKFVQNKVKPDHLFSYIYQVHLEGKCQINNNPSTSDCKTVLESIDSDDDEVIESSQPEQKFIKPLSIKNQEQESEDVINLIDLIDGKGNEHKQVDKILKNNDSLLSAVDKLRKTNDNQIICKEMDDDDEMEGKTHSAVNDKFVGGKRKITDYFVKIDKG